MTVTEPDDPGHSDPRRGVVEDRMSGIRRIVAVAGSKGGIGKSVVASLLALHLADSGRRVGLLDLDLTSPTDHVVLGAAFGVPHEVFGVDPHRVGGVDLMSVACFSRAAALPLRGRSTTEALVEMLAITRWGDKDVLVIDMPPGLGDTTLDVIDLLPRTEFVVVADGSPVVIDSVKRAIDLLVSLGKPIIGVFENMSRGDPGAVERLATSARIAYLGAAGSDPRIEDAIGDCEALRSTDLYRSMRGLAAHVNG
ncbi:MAG TPA: P-loop NTPase [Acidimicrobiia bacterium]|nr:P-loop NTPase [Acidimicrobiia bacterium]